MKQETQVALIRRLLQHVENGTTDLEVQPEDFSRRIYASPSRIAEERQTLFRRFPLVVGFSSHIKEPGDFLTHDLTGVPILVVRKKCGEVGAFVNSCRHRGAKVAQQPHGRGCKNFVCPYHAWSYDLDGNLRGVPEAHCFPRLKKHESGLVALPVVERHGMIWVVPTPGTAVDFDAYLGVFGQDLQSFGLDEYWVSATKLLPGKIDWKLMVEANQESYHINVLHKGTAGRRYRPQCSLLDLDSPHSRSILVHASAGRAPLPESEKEWRLLDHADIVYFIFPNTMLLFAGDGVQVISPYPLGVGRSVMQGARLDPPGATGKSARDFATAFYGNYWQTIVEDVNVSESIQQAASGPSAVLLQLGANEFTISEFHRHIERAITGQLIVPPRASVEGLSQIDVRHTKQSTDSQTEAGSSYVRADQC